MRVVIGAVATVLGGAVAVGLAGGAMRANNPTSPLTKARVEGTVATPQGVLPHAFLDLSTYPDSMAGQHGKSGGSQPDWVSYGPTTTLSVPAHSLVTVTIKQYDAGEVITNSYFAAVHGTVDGTMSVDGKVVKNWDPEHVAHTFTIHMLPMKQDPLFVSVPLPPTEDDAALLANGYPAPHVVTFSFVTGGKGHYIWNCEFPCGDGTYAKFGGPMSVQGYMAGTIDVV